MEEPDCNRLALQILLVAKAVWETRKKILPAVFDWLPDFWEPHNIPLRTVNRIYKATGKAFVYRVVIIHSAMKAHMK
jgi:hypothetical protein